MQVGPDCTWVKSSTRTPSSALPAWPKGLDVGRGRPLAVFFAADFFAAFFAVRGLRAFRPRVASVPFALTCFFCFLRCRHFRLLDLLGHPESPFV